MFTCLYCGKEKHLNMESSKEHVIPQFLGGKHTPGKFQVSNVCKSCNNNLGLWVDGAYAKSWLISNHLAQAAGLLRVEESDRALPLACMGHVQIPGLDVPEGYVSEYWLGPSGESIVWVRSQDVRMEPYVGGNPIDRKKYPSVAYFFPVTADSAKLKLAILSFHDSMDSKKVRKILSCELYDSHGVSMNPQRFGFDQQEHDDAANVDAIRRAIDGGSLAARVMVDASSEVRFMCKLVLGVGYVLFGDDFLNHSTAMEARKGLWPTQDGSASAIRGVGLFDSTDEVLAQAIGYQGGVAFTVADTGQNWNMGLSINAQLVSRIELGPSSMRSEHVNREEGYTLLLFPYLGISIEMTFAQFLNHKLGNVTNAELGKIDARLSEADKAQSKQSSLSGQTVH